MLAGHPGDCSLRSNARSSFFCVHHGAFQIQGQPSKAFFRIDGTARPMSQQCGFIQQARPLYFFRFHRARKAVRGLFICIVLSGFLRQVRFGGSRYRLSDLAIQPKEKKGDLPRGLGRTEKPHLRIRQAIPLRSRILHSTIVPREPDGHRVPNGLEKVCHKVCGNIF